MYLDEMHRQHELLVLAFVSSEGNDRHEGNISTSFRAALRCAYIEFAICEIDTVVKGLGDQTRCAMARKSVLSCRDGA